MPIPADFSKTVMTVNEIHDYTREFTATRREAHVIDFLKGLLHKSLRRIKVENRQTFLGRNRDYNFHGRRCGREGGCLMIVYILNLVNPFATTLDSVFKHLPCSSPATSTSIETRQLSNLLVHFSRPHFITPYVKQLIELNLLSARMSCKIAIDELPSESLAAVGGLVPSRLAP